jgi:hypothetical protein
MFPGDTLDARPQHVINADIAVESERMLFEEAQIIVRENIAAPARITAQKVGGCTKRRARKGGFWAKPTA